MIDLKHALVLDLTKLGTAYQMINSFVDNEVVQAFEVSPCGTQAVLILTSDDLIALRFIEKECLSLFKMDILKISFLENIKEEILLTYLSQNVPVLQKHLAVIELNSFADSFTIAQNLTAEGLAIVDFRAVRTCPPNLILTVTSESLLKLTAISDWNFNFKVTVIGSVQKPLRSYFEILK